MRLLLDPGLLIRIGLCAIPAVTAWGAVGHEIVGAIAQIHLHPSAQAKLVDILPEWTKGNLAPIAAWADRVRFHMPWSGQMHYISPLDDNPPKTCHFDAENVKSNINLLTAIGNYSSRLQTGYGDIDLRFLVHYMGDLHQPLHLMYRERGGNGDPVLFEGRHYSLHGLWDSQLIAKTLRTQNNYTRPLPNRQIEQVLRGSIYDSYIRWILWEGVRQWWRKDVGEWLACEGPDTSRTSQVTLGGPISEPDYYSCAVGWAKPIHNYTCTHVFPPDYDPHSQPLPELGGANYYGRIQDDKLIESLLAKGGLRLAAILNEILADPEDLRKSGFLAQWIDAAESREQQWQYKYFGMP